MFLPLHVPCIFFFFSNWLTNVDGMKNLWCSSTVQLLSAQIWMGWRIYDALVQFGCYQHRHEWMLKPHPYWAKPWTIMHIPSNYAFTQVDNYIIISYWWPYTGKKDLDLFNNIWLSTSPTCKIHTIDRDIFAVKIFRL